MTNPTSAPVGADASLERLKHLGIVLPVLQPPVASYVDAVMDNGLLYLSGKGPRKADGTRRSGKVGRDVSLSEAQEDAYLTGLNLLAAINNATGSLERVERVVKVFGMVNAADDFSAHPAVIDAFSNLMTDVFGERGRHARSAVGMGSLPNNMTIEIEMIVRIGG
jgi:enamine deaminase RidA (YjgF/YER057c/UK114 family)